jgi:glycosyltransferase involved in cell wall biosynthesis
MTEGSRGQRPRVAVVGPLPPPTHGHMVVTQRVLSSPVLRESFTLLHVDISDHGPLDDIGKLTARNVWLGFVHAARLYRTLWRKRAQLVYIPLSQNRLGLVRDAVLLSICLLSRVRVVGHVHGGGFARFLASSPRWFSTPMLGLLRRCDVLVAMSNQHREGIERVFPDTPTVVVPHGVPTAVAPREARSGALRVLYVSSSLTTSKGTFVALRAARALHAANVPTEWTIVGPWRNEAMRAAGLEIAGGLPNVRFPGEVSQETLRDLYRQADVFVFPTGPAEGFGMVRIEALAAGLPVITTPAGGGAEIVGDAGFIVAYDSPSELVERIHLLHEDRALLDELGDRARRRHRALFTEAKFEMGLRRTWHAALGLENAS